MSFYSSDRNFCLPEFNRLPSNELKPKIPEGIIPEISSLKPKKAVLFDVYGTLFISSAGDISTIEDGNSNLLRKVITDKLKIEANSLPVNLESFLKEEILVFQENRKLEGIDFPEVEIRIIWMRMLERLGFDSVDSMILCEMVTMYECLANPCYPMPGSKDLILKLVEDGYLVGIISNAQFYTQAMFKHFFGLWPEEMGISKDLCYWSYEFLEGKPSCTKYEKAKKDLMASYRVSPEEVLYVGNDMRNDIMPATKVGFQGVLFAGDSRSLRLRQKDASCANLIPKATITELNQIFDILY